MVETFEWPLEPSPEAMRRMVEVVMERLAAHVGSLGEQPASYDQSQGLALSERLIEPLPQRGEPLESLLAALFDEAIPMSFNAAGPGYLGYIPGGGLFEAALGEFIAASINRYVGVWVAAPGLVQMEANVVRWLCQIIGYPASSLGFLTSGGSIANLSATITARRDRLGEDFLDGVAYGSDQAHYSVLKAGAMAGLRWRNLRKIPSGPRQQLRLDLLEQAIEDDRRAGLSPFLLVGNAGTTNTGAVDDLEALADIARRHGLWFHVDAAYGGFFMLTERGQRILKGLSLADSVTLDPHKGLFLPFGTGALLVRDRRALQVAFDETGDYMPGFQEADSSVDFCRLSPELSRAFRGLRIWLPLKRHGVAPFQQALDEKLDLAQRAAEALAATEHVEVVAPPQLSAFAFRATFPDLSPEALDDLNRRWLERINARQRVMLTSTLLDGRFTLRLCVLSFRTHLDRLDAAIEDARAALAEVTP